jgi:hypothetical protein
MKSALLKTLSSALYASTIGLVVTPMSVTAAALDYTGDGLINAGNACKKASARINDQSVKVASNAQLRREKSRLKSWLADQGVVLPAAAWSTEGYAKFSKALNDSGVSATDLMGMDVHEASMHVGKLFAQLAFQANPDAFATQRDEREVLDVGTVPA